MEIKDLGEFGLISRLTKDIQPVNSSTVMGAGDDAAVLHYSDKETLVSSQMFMEGVQFDLTYIDMEHLAYKVAMIAAVAEQSPASGSPPARTGRFVGRP